MKNKKILVIDIGGTTIKYSIISNGKISNSIKYQDSFGINVDSLIKMIVKIYEKNSNDIEGLAISCAGPIEKNSIVNFWSAIKGLGQGLNLSQKLKNKGIDVPIHILNDANAAAYGEYKIGCGKDKKSMAFIGIGSGIGGGAVVNGILIEGFKGFGGEFGSAFRIWNKLNNQYESPQDHGGFHGMIRKFQKKYNKILTGKEIFDLYDAKDKFAQEVIEDFYDSIIRTIWLIGFTIDPEIIIIGGGLAKRQQAYKELVSRIEIFKKNEGANIEGFMNIKFTSIGNEAPLWGAYYAFLNKYKQ